MFDCDLEQSHESELMDFSRIFEQKDVFVCENDYRFQERVINRFKTLKNYGEETIEKEGL